MPRSGKEKPIMSAYIASGELGGIWGVGENKKLFCLLVYIWAKLRLSYSYAILSNTELQSYLT
jgi:hypothetical protein